MDLKSQNLNQLQRLIFSRVNPAINPHQSLYHPLKSQRKAIFHLKIVKFAVYDFYLNFNSLFNILKYNPGQKFKNKKTLSKHVKHVHHKLKQLICNVCNKQFTRKSTLDVSHLKAHIKLKLK
jgi:hypothetical protein